jgi:hypothetical protein
MDVRVELADLRPRHARQNLRHRLQHGHLQAELHANRRRLKTDIARAYHHQPRIGWAIAFSRSTSASVRSSVILRKVRALNDSLRGRAPVAITSLSHADSGAGLSKAQPCFACKIDPRGGLACHQIDIVLGVIFHRLQEQPVGVHLALEIGLRQRRPLIRRRGSSPISVIAPSKPASRNE